MTVQVMIRLNVFVCTCRLAFPFEKVRMWSAIFFYIKLITNFQMMSHSL